MLYYTAAKIQVMMGRGFACWFSIQSVAPLNDHTRSTTDDFETGFLCDPSSSSAWAEFGPGHYR